MRVNGLLLIVPWLLAGCATSQFMANRGWDAADIFTATLGAGSGIKARIGPAQIAVIDNTDIIGLRAGQGFWDGTFFVDNAEIYGPIPKTRSPSYGDFVVKKVFSESGSHTTEDYRPKDLYIYSPPPYTDWSTAFGYEVFSQGPRSASSRRGKSIFQACGFPLFTRGRPANMWTQVEIAGGLAFTIRLGFNPGELLDFILGWAAIDLYGDDLEPEPNRPLNLQNIRG